MSSTKMTNKSVRPTKEIGIQRALASSFPPLRSSVNKRKERSRHWKFQRGDGAKRSRCWGVRWRWPSFTRSLTPLVFILKFARSGLHFCVWLLSPAVIPYLCAQRQKVCLSEWMGSINLSHPRLVDSRYGDPSFLLASLRLQLKQRDHQVLEI